MLHLRVWLDDSSNNEEKKTSTTQVTCLVLKEALSECAVEYVHSRWHTRVAVFVRITKSCCSSGMMELVEGGSPGVWLLEIPRRLCPLVPSHPLSLWALRHVEHVHNTLARSTSENLPRFFAPSAQQPTRPLTNVSGTHPVFPLAAGHWPL